MLAISKPSSLGYIKMSEALRRCQHIAIRFPFSPVTAGDSQLSVESLEELTAAKSRDTVSVCVLSLSVMEE